jgi:predicted DNA-binding transcriptional regulator YafY
MGQRSSTETVVAIVQAFLQRRTWSQADLARHVGVAVPALRKRLVELATSGFPLDRDEDHPHVFWSVPKDWFPGGVVFSGEEVPDLLRQLAHLPRGAARDRLLAKVIEAAPRRPSLASPTAPVVTKVASPSEESWLPLAEDAALRRSALRVRYFTASRGAIEWRHLSVQRVVVGPPARLVATCHRSGTLKWFRVDNVLGATMDPHEPFRPADEPEVDAFLATSVDGFHAGGEPVRHAFFVRDPEARWVQSSLLDPMRAETVPGGIQVTVETTAALVVARFVVSLGAAARPETPELRALVGELARGALEAASAPFA